MSLSLDPILRNGALFIDASTLEGRFMTCPREYFYYGVRKRERSEGKEGLMFGSFMHDHLLTPHYRGTPPDIEEALRTHFPNALSDDYRNGGYAKEVWNTYTKSYPNEPFTVLRDAEGALCVEKSFAVPICNVNGIPVIWCGRMDLIVQWPDEPPSPLDHKTSAMGGETVWEQYSNSTQQTGYVWALQQLLGVKCESYCINLILTRRLTKTGAGVECVRQRFTVQQPIIDSFPEHVAGIVDHMFRCFEKEHFPMHTAQCTRKYGRCEFLPVCKLAPDQRESILSTGLYTNVTWSPLT
jgi:hypothetical protein